MRKPALLALADGTLFWGESIGVDGQTVGEVVFNTAITGYQEILTDPSYRKQIVTLTYPHIGNVGINSEDSESSAIHVSGLVVRDVPLLASSWRSESSLEAYLSANQVVAIAEIDTRQLTRILRENGAQAGCIVAGDNIDAQAAVAAAQGFPGLQGMDLAQEVTTTETYSWTQGSWTLKDGLPESRDDLPHHVVVYDYGVKSNILRMLVDRGCRLTVVPAKMPAANAAIMRP